MSMWLVKLDRHKPLGSGVYTCGQQGNGYKCDQSKKKTIPSKSEIYGFWIWCIMLGTLIFNWEEMTGLYKKPLFDYF